MGSTPPPDDPNKKPPSGSPDPPPRFTTVTTPTPNEWFDNLFFGLRVRCGPAFTSVPATKNSPEGVSINKAVIAGSFSYYTDRPIAYIPDEASLFRFEPAVGVYTPILPEVLGTEAMRLLTDCYHSCHTGEIDCSNLLTGCDAGSTRSIISSIQILNAKPPEFFKTFKDDGYIATGNCMLRLDDRSTAPFADKFCRRTKITANYTPDAKCPMFLEVLLKPALPDDDIELLQRYCGLLLTEINSVQKILLMAGTPGGGKSTIARIILSLLGNTHWATLRTHLLEERFETSSFIGRDILFAADVSSKFLDCYSAAVLKKLVGGDPLKAEVKGSNKRIDIQGIFNVLITSNCRLNVNLDGDVEAWRRRLILMEFKRPKPEQEILQLADKILATEASGILNWSLDGYDKFRADGNRIILNERQQKCVDDLLLESDSVNYFSETCLLRAFLVDSLSVEEAYQGYVNFCKQNEWTPVSRRAFGSEIPDIISRKFSISQRNDIRTPNNSQTRGWSGLKCVLPSQSGESEPDEL